VRTELQERLAIADKPSIERGSRMESLRSLAVRVRFPIGLFAGAVAVAMALASVASAYVPGQSGRVAHTGNQTTARYVPWCDTCGVADLRLEGTVDPTQVAVGDSITWRLSVNDYNTGPAYNVYVNVWLPGNVELISSYTDRGKGCTLTSTTTVHCDLDWLSDTAQFGHVILVTKVTGTGDHTLTAVTGYSSVTGPVADPNPGDNALILTATTTPPPPPVTVMTPIIESPVLLPGPLAGSRVTVGFWVMRSDNGAALTRGTMISYASVAGKAIKHAATFTNGFAYLTFAIPTAAKGKQLKVKITITSAGQAATRVATFTVY
jgi:hypothetical protein